MSDLLQPEICHRGAGTRAQIWEHLPSASTSVLVQSRSAHWASEFKAELDARGCRTYTITADGEPTLEQLEAHLVALRPHQITQVIAIGGGSAIDLGKALSALLPAKDSPLTYLEVVGDGQALTTVPLSFIAIPTTAGTGAEATKNAVIKVTAHNVKVSLRDPRMIPDIVILDPELSVNMPWNVTFMTGMDAITQLIEAYLSCRARPDTDALCLEHLPKALSALQRLEHTPHDLGSRQSMLNAAYASGVALANAGLGIVHGLAAVLGGMTSLSHGAICARLLPAALRVNRHATQHMPETQAKFAQLDRIVSTAFTQETSKAEDLLAPFIRSQTFANASLQELLPKRGTVITASGAASSTKGNPILLSSQAIGSVFDGMIL